MRLDNNKFGEEGLILGDIEESMEFTINIQSQPVIIDSLINLYEDPVGSIVREITSNCIDAHKEKDLKKVGKRGLEDDDDVKYFSDRNTIEIEYVDKNDITNNVGAFIFRDFGVGLSEKRVREIFTVFGSSTKRGDNEEIGGFGLGSKSPFAYTDTFFVRTCRNGQEYTYMLSRGQTVPTMDKIHVKKTDNLNSTEVIIPLKDRYQASQFVDAINKQLTYFPELVFKNVSAVGTLQKANIVFETEDFLLDTADYDPGILIGNVEYPLNNELLDSRIPRCGVKYKFDVGVLDLVPSREAIRYTDTTKKIILDKIKKVGTYAKRKVKEELEKETDFRKKFVKTMSANGDRSYYYYSKNPSNKDTHYFDLLCELSSTRLNIPFKFDDLEIPHDRVNARWLFQCFETTMLHWNGRTLKRDITSYPNISVESNPMYFKEKNEIHSRKKDMQLFKVLHPKASTILTLREIEFDVSGYKHVFDKKIVEEHTKEQKLLVEYVKKHVLTKKYSDIEDYDEKLERLDLAASRKANNKIFYREYNCATIWGYSQRWSNKEDNLSNIDKPKVIYGFEEDKDKLEKIKPLFTDHNVIRIAKTNKALLQKAVHVDEFLKADNARIIDIVNKQYLITSANMFLQLSNFKDIDKDMYNAYIKLVKLEKALKVPTLSFSYIEDVLKLIGVKETSMLKQEYLDLNKQLEEYTGAYPLFPYLNLRASHIYDKTFKNVLKDYVSLQKQATVNVNQTTNS